METKYMDIKEFREMGLLAEVNRTFFHPLGLALEVVVDDDGTEMLSGILDNRDAPEGIIFGDYPAEKVAKAQEFINRQHERRKKAIGFVYQERNLT